MEISRYRPEFIVFAIGPASQGTSTLAESLRSMGYRSALFFPTFESALLAAQNEIPHVIVLDAGHVNVESFLSEIRQLSPEILTILVTPGSHFLQGLQLVSRSLVYDCIVKPFVSSLELLQKLDRAATRLYFQFESEQLRDFYVKKPHSAEDKNSVRGAESVPLKGDVGALSDLHVTIRELAAMKETDGLVRGFIHAASRLTSDTPILYFKYLPGHLSLMFSQASFLPEEKFRGIGLDLRKLEGTQVDGFFANPGGAASLGALVGEIFKKDRFTAFVHRTDQEIVGLFVILDRIELDSHHELACLREAFDLAYKRNQVIKEKHAVDFLDSLTGLSNQRHFSRTLGEEISRSRRLLLPVSILSVSIDRFDALIARLGAVSTDSIIKLMAQMFRKTARTNDTVARVGPGDFAFILSHTAQIGAAVKAERLRRAIESMRFPIVEKFGGGAVTISCGVSEYPSLAGDADALVRSADEALFEVKKTGGNKICFAYAPSGFAPDFVAREVPSSPRLGEGGIG